MRTLCWWSLVGAAAVALMGCSGSGPVAPSGQGLNPAAGNVFVDTTGQLAQMAGPIVHFDLDVAKGTAKVSPYSRKGSTIGDLFLLNVDQFSCVVAPDPSGTFQNFNGVANTVEFHYLVKHPFAAPPNPTGAASAGNRADLGITGRAVFLVDAPAGRVADATSALNKDDYEFTFGTNTVVMDTKDILNADGYIDPGALLAAGSGDAGYTPQNGTTAYPYRVLVNDGVADSRIDSATSTAIPRGADSHGNWTVGTPFNDVANATGGIKWAGYGYLHQGQTAKNFVVINIASGSSVSLNAMVIANYADPRGGATPAERKANRLPSGDATKFAYKAPHCAVDDEHVAFGTLSAASLGAAAASTVTSDISVVDQDANATVDATATAPLDSVPFASGVASITLASDELGAQVAVGTSTGTGSYETPLTYAGTVITNTNGTNGGTADNAAYVCVEVVDAQENATDPGLLGKGASLNNDAPPTALADQTTGLHFKTYQVVKVPIA